MNVTIDLGVAQQYLTRIDEDDDKHIFQLIKATKAHVLVGTLAELAERLVKANRDGFGVYITINHSSTGRRIAGDIDRVRAVFGDMDGAPLENINAAPIRPQMIIESSPGKYHIYWLCDGLPLETFVGVQKRIAKDYGADAVCCDLPRVLRVPGFVHVKGDSAPFITRILEIDGAALPYGADDIVKAFPPLANGDARGSFEDTDAKGYLAHLRAIGHGEGGEGMHAPITRAIASYFSQYGEDAQPGPLKANIRAAVDVAVVREGYPSETLSQVTGDAYLDRSIQGARAKFGGANAVRHVADDGMHDVANAQRIVRKFGERMRYSDALGYMIYRGRGVFLRDPSSTLARRLAERAMAELFDEIADAEDQNKAFKFAKKSRSAASIDAALKLVPVCPGIIAEVEDFDADPWAFNTPGKLIALGAGAGFMAVQKASPDFMCSKMSLVHYDPSAKCPRWMEFLDEIMLGDQKLIWFLQRAVGYSMTGVVREHVLFFLFGGGANGKSVFREIIAEMLGSYAQITRITTLTATHGAHEGVPNDVAALAGSRAVFVSETDDGQRMKETLIKDLTGGDRVQARFLRKEFFEFRPTGKIWICGNHKPQITGTDDGIWRRILLVPFLAQFRGEDADVRLVEKLRDELPGILNWAIDGCRLWQEMGLNPPDRITEEVRKYRHEQDAVGQFVADCVAEELGSEVRAMDLYGRYKIWCVENGRHPKSNTKFGRELEGKGMQKRRSGPGNIYEGVRLVSDVTF